MKYCLLNHLILDFNLTDRLDGASPCSRFFLRMLRRNRDSRISSSQRAGWPTTVSVPDQHWLRITLDLASEWQMKMWLPFVNYKKPFNRYAKMKLCLGSATRKPTRNQIRNLLSFLLFLVVFDGIMHNATNGKGRRIERVMFNVLEDLEHDDGLCLLSHTSSNM